MKDNSSEFGMNKTPTQLHPAMTQSMIQGCEEFPPHTEDTGTDAFTMRKSYNENQEQLGAVPMPSTLKGAVSSGLQAVQGNRPSVLIDKLGERLAFERCGVRLYDALITKCKSVDPAMNIARLEQFRNDEAEHFALVQDCIVFMGGDPTAQTPCADSLGVAAMGIMQVLNDPRSSLAQCVEAILMAELADTAAWELLIDLVNKADLGGYIAKFQLAKATEDRHMQTIKDWLHNLTLSNEIKAVA